MACCAPGASDYRGNLVLLPEGKTGAKSVKVPVQVEVTKRAKKAHHHKRKSNCSQQSRTQRTSLTSKERS